MYYLYVYIYCLYILFIYIILYIYIYIKYIYIYIIYIYICPISVCLHIVFQGQAACPGSPPGKIQLSDLMPVWTNTRIFWASA